MEIATDGHMAISAGYARILRNVWALPVTITSLRFSWTRRPVRLIPDCHDGINFLDFRICWSVMSQSSFRSKCSNCIHPTVFGFTRLSYWGRGHRDLIWQTGLLVVLRKACALCTSNWGLVSHLSSIIRGWTARELSASYGEPFGFVYVKDSFRIPLNTSLSLDRSLCACHSSPKKDVFLVWSVDSNAYKNRILPFPFNLSYFLPFPERQRSAHWNLVSDGSGRHYPRSTVDRCNQRCLLCPLHFTISIVHAGV